MHQIIVHTQGTCLVLDVPRSPRAVLDIEEPEHLPLQWIDSEILRRNGGELKTTSNGPMHHFLLNGRLVEGDRLLLNGAGPMHIRAVVAGGLKGGKGGFGANLRSSGRAGVAQHTIDFGLCRDLNGRRLKIVNDELRMRKWASSGEAAKRAKLGPEYQEAAGDHGIRGWLLGVPAWAEGVKPVRSDLIDASRARRKSRLCRDWVAARAHEGRRPPHGAAPWWGCPRGQRCEFAHGEEDMRLADRVDAVEARKNAARERVEMLIARSTAGLSLYGELDDVAGAEGGGGGAVSGHAEDAGSSFPRPRSMLAAVQSGMQAQSSHAAGQGAKRGRGGEGSPSPTQPQPRPECRLVLPIPTPSPISFPVRTVPCSSFTTHTPPSWPVLWQDGGWAFPVAMPAPEVAADGSMAYLPSVDVSYDSSVGDGEVAVLCGSAPFGTVLLPSCAIPSALGSQPSDPLTGGPVLRDACYGYSVTCLTPSHEGRGVVQAGWARLTAFRPHPDAGLGVGDDGHSWGVDIGRGLAWHTPRVGPGSVGVQDDVEVEDEGREGEVDARMRARVGGLREYAHGAHAFGPHAHAASSASTDPLWTQGAVLGVLLDVHWLNGRDEGESGACSSAVVPPEGAHVAHALVSMRYMLNGQDLGVAFQERMEFALERSPLPASGPGWIPSVSTALCAAISLDAGESVNVSPWARLDTCAPLASARAGTAPPAVHVGEESAVHVSPTSTAYSMAIERNGREGQRPLDPEDAAPSASALAPAPAPAPAAAHPPAPFDLDSAIASACSIAQEAWANEAEGSHTHSLVHSLTAFLTGPRGPLFPPRLAGAGCTPAQLTAACIGRGVKGGGTLAQKAERLAAACAARQQ